MPLKNFGKINWKDKRFYHVSTDEVYGTLGETGLFEETTPYDPNSPYSASKLVQTILYVLTVKPMECPM